MLKLGELVCETWIGLDTIFEFKNPQQEMAKPKQQQQQCQTFTCSTIAQNSRTLRPDYSILTTLGGKPNNSSLNTKQQLSSSSSERVEQPNQQLGKFSNDNNLAGFPEAFPQRSLTVEPPSIGTSSGNRNSYRRPTELRLKVIKDDDTVNSLGQERSKTTEETNVHKRSAAIGPDLGLNKNVKTKRLMQHNEQEESRNEEPSGAKEESRVVPPANNRTSSRVSLIDEFIISVGLEF